MIGLILDHLWQSTLFAGVAALLTLTLTSNGAQVRYYLWFAASVKFLIPFAGLTALGTLVLTSLAPPVAAPSLLLLRPMALPFSANSLILSATPAPGLDLAQIVTPLLLALWAIGFIAITTRWLARWSRLQHVLHRAFACPLAAPVPVKMAPSMLEPGLVGIWRPVILLPQGITERLSQTEMDAILAHEICHLRRRDNLLAATHMLVEAVFWFHPLVWWLGARLNAEREHACDEAVLAQGQSPQVYAECILKVCQFYLHSPLDCAASISGADLKKRMETIMENRLSLRLNVAKKMLLAGSAAIAIAAPLVAGLVQVQPVLAQTTVVRTIPSPGTEAALRRFITGQVAGNPPYDLLSPQLADNVRKAPAQDRGALKSLTFKGAYGSFDVYEAQYEKAKIAWVAGPLTPDGKISTLSFQKGIERALGTESSASPGVQQALRQLLDGRYRNQVPFTLLGDEIAARLQQGRTPLGESSESFQALGPVQSLTFLKVDVFGNDQYLAVYLHGHATWIVPPLVDGKVDNLLWSDILIDNAPSHSGTEDAVRRYINTAQNGGQDYSQLVPARAVSEARVADALKRLGALKSVAFKGGFRNMDVYEATFANGATNFTVVADASGKMQVVSDLGSNG